MRQSYHQDHDCWTKGPTDFVWWWNKLPLLIREPHLKDFGLVVTLPVIIDQWPSLFLTTMVGPKIFVNALRCPSVEDIHKLCLENHWAWEWCLSFGLVADTADCLLNVQWSCNYFFRVVMCPDKNRHFPSPASTALRGEPWNTDLAKELVVGVPGGRESPTLPHFLKKAKTKNPQSCKAFHQALLPGTSRGRTTLFNHADESHLIRVASRKSGGGQVLTQLRQPRTTCFWIPVLGEKNPHLVKSLWLNWA